MRRNHKGNRKGIAYDIEEMRQVECPQSQVQKVFQEDGNNELCQILLTGQVR